MNENNIKERLHTLAQSGKLRKIIIIAGVLGIALIMLPGFLSSGNTKSDNDESFSASSYGSNIQRELESLISDIEGAGKTRVLLTMENSAEYVYLENGTTKTKAIEPRVRGVLVICEGGDDPVAVGRITEAVTKALDISVTELLSGEDIRNRNQSSNMRKSRFYVCPVCGNVVRTTGEAVISCCGITLPALEPKDQDEEHTISVEIAEDEYYVTVIHPMRKDHYISFLAAVSDQQMQFVKLYPEGNAEARFKINRVKTLYAYCNRHGMFRRVLRQDRSLVKRSDL